LGTGSGGRDKGAVVPRGVFVTGEPPGVTDQTGATLRVGPHHAAHGIPRGGWPHGAGYTHYKWRLDGGDWSEETPVEKPIELAALKPGAHAVEVVGKRDSGTWQNDPALGPFASVTKSRTWTVQPRK
jgi:hypothetical protein